jgi:hypothetical protein
LPIKPKPKPKRSYFGEIRMKLSQTFKKQQNIHNLKISIILVSSKKTVRKKKNKMALKNKKLESP